MLAKRIIPCLDVDNGRVKKALTLSTSLMLVVPSILRLPMRNRAPMSSYSSTLRLRWTDVRQCAMW